MYCKSYCYCNINQWWFKMLFFPCRVHLVGLVCLVPMAYQDPRVPCWCCRWVHTSYSNQSHLHHSLSLVLLKCWRQQSACQTVPFRRGRRKRSSGVGTGSPGAGHPVPGQSKTRHPPASLFTLQRGWEEEGNGEFFIGEWGGILLALPRTRAELAGEQPDEKAALNTWRGF